MNVHDFKAALNDEDKEMFNRLDSAGWVVELDNFQLTLRNCDLNTIHARSDTEKEFINQARKVYEKYCTETTPETETEEINPSTASARHLKKAHEADLRTGLIKLFESEKIHYKLDVEWEQGAVEFVTEDAAYELLHTPSAEGIVKASERLTSYLALADNTSPAMTGTILVCCVDNLEELQEIAEIQDISVTTLERMNLTESSDEVTTQNILSEPPKPDSIVSHAVPLRQEITLSRIRTDGGTQPRAQLNFLTIDEYAEAMQEGAKFPPVTLFYDGSEYWLADGFHRVAAARKAGRETIDCEVTQGTRRDAVLYSLGANATHGLPRTNEDKRRAVKMLLEDKEWAEWSDSLIAQKTSTSQPFVSKLRRELFPESAARTVRRGADNIVRDTARIGARDKDSTEETSPLFEKPEGLAVSDSGEDVETEESKTDAPPSQDAEQTEPPKEQAKAKIVEDGIALTADPQPPAHNEPVSAEQEKAWEKAQIEIKIQIMRADGHLEGRRVMIIAHEEGGLPLTKIERSTDSVLPGLNALLSLINTLKAELPLRLSKKTDATKPSQKPATATKKKPTRATKKAATKKPAARKSTKKQSTKVEGAK